MGNELLLIALPLGPCPYGDWGRGALARRSGRGRLASASLGAAHGRDQLVAVECGGAVGGDDLAVAHDDDAVRVFEDLAEELRDQDGARAARDDAADEGEELAGGLHVEGRSGLVEDDETERVFG